MLILGLCWCCALVIGCVDFGIRGLLEDVGTSGVGVGVGVMCVLVLMLATQTH